jgi:chaperonin cofactor prefoldin
MKTEMTKSEMDRYWKERRERLAKRVKAMGAKGDWLTSEIEKYQEDLDEILKKG